MMSQNAPLSSSTIHSLSVLLLVLVTLGTILGCNRPPQATYPVKGVVKWNDGQSATELESAGIELQVIEGPAIRVSPRGDVGPDGTFVLRTYGPADGAPEGEYRAVIMPWVLPDLTVKRPPPIVDKRFQSFQSTPLRVTVKPEPNDIVLTVDRLTKQ
jgi:hypothetical protein